MEFVRAKSAGFCMGVSLALHKLDNIIDRKSISGDIYILGSIIHNPQVVQEYADKGIISADSPEEIPSGSIVVIRAHGITKQVQKTLSQRGIHVIDATCPKVKDACLLIEKNTADDRVLLLFGEEFHPEVKCLLSYAAGKTVVFNSFEKCKACDFDPSLKYCLAAQTTQDKHIFDEISRDLLKRKGLNLVVLHTICNATKTRQDEATTIADDTDFVIVAGGYNSSNTRRLAQVIEAHGTKALHIETAADLPLDELRKFKKIGLTAGASTPKKIVDEIQRTLESL
ncbi:4-hydroxy-3-methylbut-2-enyl diphosphate reductase [Desulfuromusa kysingii]|uniref:4-hydroxy-3-methylbut-2-enyl diphosphate reductase n=1 Tax=Desulfuromusa kysingii TaxID=37625 RepID=A0A1H4DPY0_9BACT|nr:4-hydroxy-3-methylbut-2-enyl diphosphate reductase [Desulfuromusa kysingii]SEA74677.1 4-hydroxy-3-methylbut-2-enyl diphosphate reductase [Desulfuromusa kysingii]